MTTIVPRLRERVCFGDFQTPPALATDVCRLLRKQGVRPRAILEPTCGRGSLLLAALEHFPDAARVVGVDLNQQHLEFLRGRLARTAGADKVELIHADFFTLDWERLVHSATEPLLVLGNPPWVTSAELGKLGGSNLPPKNNHQRFSGLDAVTGKSNFDVSEWMLLRTLEWLAGRRGFLAMLCKTSVARKLLRHAWQQDLPITRAALFAIDAARHFAARVGACLLLCEFSSSAGRKTAGVHEQLDARCAASQLGWRNGDVVADVRAFDRWSPLLLAEVKQDFTWRSGIKHDCSKIMELVEEADGYRNRLGERVDIERTCLFPMLKGAAVARGQPASARWWMIVPQRSIRADAEDLRLQAPRTWSYLHAHRKRLDARKSSIYRGRGPFAIFGVGQYTFASHKIATCGFYPQLQFQIIGRHRRRPVVFDDTVYFLPCRSQTDAKRLLELLHSEPAQEFLGAYIFRDAKRPVTAQLLQRLDLRKLAQYLGVQLPSYASP